MPLLSIIVPVYNVEKYLQRCLDSILSQTFRDFEVILVDDGSTDSSSEICDSYSRTHPQIRTLHIQNSGPANARNVGLDNVSEHSKYVSFIDGDDFIEKSMYEEMLAEFDDNTDAIISNFIIEYDTESLLINTFDPVPESIELTIKNFLCDGDAASLWNKIYRLNLIRKNMLRFRDYRYAEDFLFNIDYLTRSQSVRKIDSCLYHYNRNNQQSIVATEGRSYSNVPYFMEIMYTAKDIFSSSGFGTKFDIPLIWRVQLLKSDWVLQPSEYGKYYETWPEGNKYLLSNPFLHKKMKIAMWLLDHHISLPLRIASLIMQKK